jgi:serine/threonine-protein kinase
VIHTDLKPSNIVVTKNGEPFVLDFGLAKSIGGTDTLSRPGMVAGTIPYMSPEQAAGHRDTLDMSTDVYSLGVMLFELLTGQSPRNRTDDAQEMLRRIREEPVKRPRKLSKEVDAEIEALLLKALRDEPANRYRNAGDLADDIDNYLIGEPLTAKAPSTAYLLRKRAWKHRVPVTLAIAVVVILSVMASLNYYRFARTTTDFVHANNRSTATVAAELVARDLEQALSLAQSYAAFAGMIESVEQHDAQAVRDRLQALVKSNARIDHAAVFDPDGNMWSDYPPAEGALGKNFRNYRWYRHRAQGWKTAYISEVYRRIEEPRVLVVAANAPIFNRQQEVIGALTCQYRIEQITEWLKQIKLGQSGYVFALDHNGAVTAHPQIDLQSRVPGDYRYAGLPSVKRAVQGEASTVIYTDPVAKREMVATFMPVKVWPWNWVVVSQQPVDEAFAAVHQLRLQIIITFCILAAVAVVVVVALAWSSRPRFPAARSST